MRATWRALPVWPYPPRARLEGRRFGNSLTSGTTPWDSALEKLEDEIQAIGGGDVLIGVVVTDEQISFSGNLKSGGRTAFRHRGAEVSFEVPKQGRVVFSTDAFDDVTQNLRAIALGLEALRAVKRYGITSGTEQYAGFAMLSPGEDLVQRGQKLVEAAGGLSKALKAHHPDRGGSDDDMRAVLAFKEHVGA